MSWPSTSSVASIPAPAIVTSCGTCWMPLKLITIGKTPAGNVYVLPDSSLSASCFPSPSARTADSGELRASSACIAALRVAREQLLARALLRQPASDPRGRGEDAELEILHAALQPLVGDRVAARRLPGIADALARVLAQARADHVLRGGARLLRR